MYSLSYSLLPTSYSPDDGRLWTLDPRTRGPEDRLGTQGPKDPRTQGPEDPRTRGPEDQPGTQGPEDRPGTQGPEDQRTRGPEDPRTWGPEDPRTQGPEDPRTQGPKDPRTQWSNSFALSFYDRNAPCVKSSKLKHMAVSLWVTESALLYTQ